MKFSPDDPRLTAYVLGELPELEVKELEQELAKSAELRQAVDEIRQTIGLLQRELATEPAEKLSPAQKEAVVAKANDTNIVHLAARSFWRTAAIGAIAASIVIGFVWGFWIRDEQQMASAPAEDLEIAIMPREIATSAPLVAPPMTVPPASVPQPEPVRVATTPPPSPPSEAKPASSPTMKTFAQKQPEPEKPVTRTFRAQTPAQPEARQVASTATLNYGLVDSGARPALEPADGQQWALASSGIDYKWRENTALAEQELNDLRKRYTENHPIVERQKEKLHSFYARIQHETARYPKYVENDFQPVLQNPLSTFSIDVDTASYANVRRFLNENRLPPRDAVRIEEMINYFSYSYPQPKGDEPFAVNMEVTGCPWEPQHRLLRVGLKGKEIAQDKRPPSNFVFLIDVSGSMSPRERLPLIKQALRMLVKKMTENDRIAIVVYASSSGVVLESTSCANKEKILAALDRLEAGGSTNGGQGIQRAYGLAEENFIKNGVNRVILCTDGDFNVGITDQNELINLIQRKAKTGVFLSALGVGDDNYKDALLQKLADKGNGNYYYIDTMEEAHKVLVQQMNGTLVTIAKDVKIQIEFNPAQVSSYRLIGYEKRILEAEDFNNDKKDAGEIGAGHTVTALYELVPAGLEATVSRVPVDDLKYQTKPAAQPAKREISTGSKELLTLKLRYKKPASDKSVLREHTLTDDKKKFTHASTDTRFAAAVASLGMILKDSEYKGSASLGSVLELAKEAKGDDKEGYRAEFINLVKKAKSLKRGED